jgi:hypothetical protein
MKALPLFEMVEMVQAREVGKESRLKKKMLMVLREKGKGKWRRTQ